MRIYIARNASWFPVPALQFTTRCTVLPWSVVLWWGNRGLQLDGDWRDWRPDEDDFSEI